MSAHGETPILSVRGLRVEFALRRGVLTAVDGVSFDVARGEVLGVVGESGAGKSVTGAAVIGLIDPPGRVAGGEIRLDGERIDPRSEEEMRRIRGRRIGMIFQDPLTSLNPLFSIGDQLVETQLLPLEPVLAGEVGGQPSEPLIRGGVQGRPVRGPYPQRDLRHHPSPRVSSIVS